MAIKTIYQPAQAASDGTTVPHPTYNAREVEWFIVTADNLAGVEEIDVYVQAGATYIVAKDENGVAFKLAATAATNNALQLQFAGGLMYQFRKDATGGDCGIYIIEGPGMNR
jgi:hypothetical protein